MKNKEEIEVIDALITIKNYCSKRDSAGGVFLLYDVRILQ